MICICTGDMAFTFSMLGLGGSSSSMPSTYRDVSLSHLRVLRTRMAVLIMTGTRHRGKIGQVSKTTLKP